MNYTKNLASYSCKLKYEDLPQEVVLQAKLLTLHVIGVALAALPTRQGQDAVALARMSGSEPREATIYGVKDKVPVTQAGFANGTLADVLDWEDCSPTGHPSAGAIPAALAVAEGIRASGKDYIAAVVAAYEVYQRIALAVQPTAEYWTRVGWGLCSWQVMAPAIAAAKLWKLDADRTAQAIGAAATFTPIPSRKINPDSRSDIYHYQHGTTCRDGILAAMVARRGMDGLHDVLDGETGYWVSVSDHCDWELLHRGLGDEYLIMSTLFKYWPANMWIQQYLDCMNSLLREEQVRAADVAEIIVSPSMQQRSSRMIYRPEGYLGIMDAEFSIPYCLAAILLDPEPGPNWFTADRLKSPELLALAAKVRASGPEVNPYENFRMFQRGEYNRVTVEVVLNSGKRLARSSSYPKGHPRNRLSLAQYEQRFRRAASFALPSKNIDDLLDSILHLEEVADISRLGSSLHP